MEYMTLKKLVNKLNDFWQYVKDNPVFSVVMFIIVCKAIVEVTE
jgi:hypothetical protein